MELGLIGLGRMGAGMALRLLRDSHRVVAYDRDPQATQRLAAQGAVAASSPAELVDKLTESPRAVWLMVPAGEATGQAIEGLLPLLKAGDIVIDGGNSYYKDSLQRAAMLRERGLHFVDAGTSGGIWGEREGYCLMIGADAETFRRLEPVFRSLAPAEGYDHVGPNGAGHFVKMVHNGIEYGMLQAYAEGFELLQASHYELDLAQVARLWNHGGVVRSWLLELAERALKDDPGLSSVKGYVDDSGEGRWTVLEAVERAVSIPVLTASLYARFRSRQEESFAAKVIAALRREFGGHAVRPKEGTSHR